MANENLNIDVTADTKKASKEIDGLQKDVDKLEKSKPELEVTADTKAASKALDGVDKQAHELTTEDFEITVQAKVDKVLGDFDQITAKTKETKAAADALGAALGPELAAKADTSALVGELEKAGLSLDEIKANADQLAPKLQELADADVGGKLGASLGTAKGKSDELGKSADSSKSALANMVGNSAQDLGALGGAAGSTGVLIGQMAEYMADASFSGEKFGSVIKNFAAIAGPAAALGLVISTVTTFMAKQAEQAKITAERNKEMGDAMAGAADDAVGIADALKSNLDPLRDFDAGLELLGSRTKTINDLGRSIPLIGNLFEDTSRDVVSAMSDAGVSIYDFTKAIQGNEHDRFAFLLNLRTLASLGAITEDQFTAIAGAVDEYSKSVADGNKAQALFNVKAEDANAILGELVTKADPLSKFSDVWASLMKDMADGSIDTEASAEAINFLADKLGLTTEEVIKLAKAKLDENMQKSAQATEDASKAFAALSEETAKGIEARKDFNTAVESTDFKNADLEGAVTAMSAFTEQHFALIDIAADSEEAYDNFSQAVKDNSKEIKDHTKVFDVSTEAGRSNQKALEEVAKTLDTKLAAAYTDSGGDMDVFKGKASAIRDEAVKRLMPALDGSGLSAKDLADKLGLADGDWEARFKLSGDEEAKIKIGLLQTAINNLPKDVQATVTQKIIAGDYQGALATVQNYYNNHPAHIDTVVDYPSAGEMSQVGGYIASYYRSHKVPISAVVLPGVFDQGGTVGQGGGIAGERGPEIVERNGATGVVVGPTYVPPGTKVTSTRKSRQILARRRPKMYANGTPASATIPVGGGAMTFVFQQQAPIYGVADLDRHLEKWSNQVAAKISAGKR